MNLKECDFSDKKGIQCGKVAHWKAGKSVYCCSHKYKCKKEEEPTKNFQTSYQKKPIHIILGQLREKLEEVFPNPKFDHVFIEDMKKISVGRGNSRQKRWNNALKEIVCFLRAYFMIKNIPPLKRKLSDVWVINPSSKFQIDQMKPFYSNFTSSDEIIAKNSKFKTKTKTKKLDYTHRKKALTEIILNLFDKITPGIKEKYFTMKKVDDPIDAFAIAFIPLLGLYKNRRIICKKSKKVLECITPC